LVFIPQGLLLDAFIAVFEQRGITDAKEQTSPWCGRYPLFGISRVQV